MLISSSTVKKFLIICLTILCNNMFLASKRTFTIANKISTIKISLTLQTSKRLTCHILMIFLSSLKLNSIKFYPFFFLIYFKFYRLRFWDLCPLLLLKYFKFLHKIIIFVYILAIIFFYTLLIRVIVIIIFYHWSMSI